MSGLVAKVSSYSVITDAAQVLNGAMSLEDVAAKHKMAMPALLDYLGDPAMLADVEARAVELRQDGTSYQIAAMTGLGRIIEQMNANIESGTLSHTSLLRTAEFYHQSTGLQARTAAMARATEPPQREKISVVIAFGDRTVVIGDHPADELQTVDITEVPNGTFPSAGTADVIAAPEMSAESVEDVTAGDHCFPKFIQDARLC